MARGRPGLQSQQPRRNKHAEHVTRTLRRKRIKLAHQQVLGDACEPRNNESVADCDRDHWTGVVMHCNVASLARLQCCCSRVGDSAHKES